jgi:hypothetical protein
MKSELEQNEARNIKTLDTARQAEAILNHPLHIAAMGILKELTQDKFKGLKNSDVLAMQECNLRLKLIDELEESYSILVSNGKTAFAQLEEIAEFKKVMNK